MAVLVPALSAVGHWLLRTAVTLCRRGEELLVSAQDMRNVEEGKPLPGRTEPNQLGRCFPRFSPIHRDDHDLGCLLKFRVLDATPAPSPTESDSEGGTSQGHG